MVNIIHDPVANVPKLLKGVSTVVSDKLFHSFVFHIVMSIDVLGEPWPTSSHAFGPLGPSLG